MGGGVEGRIGVGWCCGVGGSFRFERVGRGWSVMQGGCFGVGGGSVGYDGVGPLECDAGVGGAVLGMMGWGRWSVMQGWGGGGGGQCWV